MITSQVLQKYAKQIKQAKLEEFRSFLDFTAMKFRDRRKHKIENFVTGRWVLTIKTDKDGQFKKFKARWVCRGFQDAQKWDLQTILPQLPAMVSALPHSMPRLVIGIFCILTLKPRFFRGNLRLRTPRNPRATSIGHWFTTLSCWFVYSFGLRFSRCT